MTLQTLHVYSMLKQSGNIVSMWNTHGVFVENNIIQQLLLLFIKKHFIGKNKTDRRYFSGFTGLRTLPQLHN